MNKARNASWKGVTLVTGSACAAAAAVIVWAWQMRYRLPAAVPGPMEASQVVPAPGPLPFGVAWIMVLGLFGLLYRTVPAPRRPAWTGHMGLALLGFAPVVIVYLVLPRQLLPDAMAGLAARHLAIPGLFLLALTGTVYTVLTASAAWEQRIARLRPRHMVWLLFLLVHLSAFWFAKPWRERPYRHENLGGDEPRYLLMTHSLATDLDFNLYNNLKNNHRRRYIVPGPTRQERENAFYAERARHWGAKGPPHTTPEYWEGRRYGIERLGLPMILAPGYRVGLALGRNQRYGAVFMLSLLLTFTMVNIYRLACGITRRRTAALLATLAAGLGGPLAFYGITAYPEIAGAAFIVFTVRKIFELAQARREGRQATTASHAWLALGLAYLPWIHEKMIPFLCVLLLFYLAAARPSWRRLGPLALLLSASLVLQMRYYWLLYGQVFPPNVHPHPFSLPHLAQQGFWGLLFDRTRGILPMAPWFAFGAAGLILWARRQPGYGIWAVCMAVGFLVVTGAFTGWWGGTSPQPRYITNVMPLFAVGLAVSWSATGSRVLRALMAALCILGIAQGYSGTLVPEILASRQAALLRPFFPSVTDIQITTMIMLGTWSLVFLCCLVAVLAPAYARHAAAVAVAALAMTAATTAVNLRRQRPEAVLVGATPLLERQLFEEDSMSNFNRKVRTLGRMNLYSSGFDESRPIIGIMETSQGWQAPGADRIQEQGGDVFLRSRAKGAKPFLTATAPAGTRLEGFYRAGFVMRRAPHETEQPVGQIKLVVHSLCSGETFGSLILSVEDLPDTWSEIFLPFTLTAPTRMIALSLRASGEPPVDLARASLQYLAPYRRRHDHPDDAAKRAGS